MAIHHCERKNDYKSYDSEVITLRIPHRMFKQVAAMLQVLGTTWHDWPYIEEQSDRIFGTHSLHGVHPGTFRIPLRSGVRNQSDSDPDPIFLLSFHFCMCFLCMGQS